MNAVGYVVAQVVGAIAASGVVLLVAGQAAVAATASGVPRGQGGRGVVVETLLTAIFLLVILTVTKRAPNQAAFAIPLTLVVIHFAGIPFSGASVNPARSLAPALVGGDARPEHLRLDRRPAARRGDRLWPVQGAGGQLHALRPSRVCDPRP